MMTHAAIAVAVILTLAGAFTVFRIIRGPTTLDRIVATDVLLAITVALIAVEAAYSRDSTALPILVVLSILGFTGAVAVARFAAREKR